MGTANYVTLAGAGASSGSSFLPTTQTYLAKITANGGTILDATLTAHDTLYTGMNSAGLTTGLEFLWTQCGLDFAASKVAYIHPNTDHLVTTTGFVAGDWSEATGYNPGGSNTTKYVDSLWLPDMDAFTFGWYNHSNNAYSNKYWGFYDQFNGNNTRFEIWPKYTDNSFYGYNYRKNPNELISSATSANGFWINSWGDTSAFVKRNGTTIGTLNYSAASSGNATDSVGLWALKNRLFGGATQWGAHVSDRMSLFIGWGRALSEAEASTMNGLVSDFYTAIGRS